ncbi:MAG: hypothetical protein C4524_07345 [Candidatus Zixiibacteriota bacterium]|nr:MAG: hypothetical protein C4524_07345 [candidate division Zixibacteria bacterium]
MPTLRDAAYAMEESLRQIVEYIVNRKQHLSRYYILIHAKTYDTDTIFSKVVILSTRPPKLLGTVCYEIDNRAGTQKRLWVLPLDIPVDVSLLSEQSVPEAILKSAEGMLIFN